MTEPTNAAQSDPRSEISSLPAYVSDAPRVPPEEQREHDALADEDRSWNKFAAERAKEAGEKIPVSYDDLLHRIAFNADSYGRSLLSDLPSEEKFVRPGIKQIMKIADEAVLHTSKAQQAVNALNDLDGHWAIGSIDMKQVGHALTDIATSIEPLYEDRIAYHGIDMTEHDARLRAVLEMPGEEVRPRDPNNALLGEGPHTVSAVHVTGIEADNGIGGRNMSYVSEYEFEDVEGRHKANLFQPEKGIDGHYSVLLVQDDRLWLAPMDGNFDQPQLAGPVREVTGFAGRAHDNLHPEGFDAFKAEISEKAAAGDVSYMPEAFGSTHGTVSIVAIPWTSGTDHAELAQAKEHVLDRLADERMAREDRLRAEMTDQIFDYRSAMRLPAVTEASEQEARARSEAEFLLDSRPNDAFTRMVASEVVTEGLEDVSARKIADGLSPSAEAVREKIADRQFDETVKNDNSGSLGRWAPKEPTAKEAAHLDGPKGALRAQAAALAGALSRAEPKGPAADQAPDAGVRRGGAER